MAPRRGLLDPVPPRQRHRLAEQFFIHDIEAYRRAPLKSPRALLGDERLRCFLHESLLLIRRQDDHAPFVVGVQRGKDAVADAKVGMIHVGALDGVLHAESDAAEVVVGHWCLRWSAACLRA